MVPMLSACLSVCLPVRLSVCTGPVLSFELMGTPPIWDVLLFSNSLKPEMEEHEANKESVAKK